MAQEACERGAVQVDGRPARSGQTVRRGQRVILVSTRGLLEVEILDLPPRPASREAQGACYRVVRDERETGD